MSFLKLSYHVKIPLSSPMTFKSRFIISLALSALLLGVFFYNTSVGKIFQVIRDLSIPPIGMAMVFTLLSILIRVFRWQLLLSVIHKPSFANASAATFMGYALSTLLPARAGEVLRPLYLAAQEGMSRTITLSSAVLERLMDLPLILLFALFIFDRKLFLFLALMGFFLFFSFLYAIKTKRARLEGWAKGRKRPFWRRVFLDLSRALDLLPRGVKGVMIWGLTFLIWFSVALQNYAILKAFHLALPFGSNFALIAAMGLGFVIPTPGGVGGVHKSLQVLLHSFYNVNYHVASAVALILHAESMGILTLIGVGYILKRKVWWKDFWQGAKINR